MHPWLQLYQETAKDVLAPRVLNGQDYERDIQRSKMMLGKRQGALETLIGVYKRRRDAVEHFASFCNFNLIFQSVVLLISIKFSVVI